MLSVTSEEFCGSVRCYLGTQIPDSIHRVQKQFGFYDCFHCNEPDNYLLTTTVNSSKSTIILPGFSMDDRKSAK